LLQLAFAFGKKPWHDVRLFNGGFFFGFAALKKAPGGDFLFWTFHVDF